ncbi:MAG: tRNA (N(6)-L-threonylcarbamoyladenosine(37)-C(2))-methylthiotransferase MtaB, partial [Candidatus Neomarinimicrobiota bacterium]
MGCKLNYSETGTISRDFMSNGFEKVGFREKADIYVVNTCSVTENADKEARKLIRQAKRRNPESLVAVMGCYAQLKPQEISSIPGVNIVLGHSQKFNLLQHLSNLETSAAPTVFKDDINQTDIFRPSYSAGERTRSYLKIQDGCDYSCSYCTIPLARGKSRNNSILNTLETARELAGTKTREIVLTGVNIGDFGQGKEETFFQLIQELDKLEQIDRIRISSIEPNLITDDIIEFCAGSRKFMPHFHLPLQSGSDEMLALMSRRYNRRKYTDRIQKIKEILPQACIGCDVIVGFPGETKRHFLETFSFLNELDISYLHVFTYSERSGTKAPSFGGLVHREERAERSKMLHILSTKKRHAFQEKFIGKKRQVLFESVKNGKLWGHTDNYIQVQVKEDPAYINSILPVTLDSNSDFGMIGTISGESF